MRAALATIVFSAIVAANPVPQAVTSAIAPQGSPPPGCSPNYDGTFVIGPVNVSSSEKRDLDERNTQLGITLQNGILTDPQGRTGYVASNEQFQFDGPPQAGAIWTAGFSVCENGSLALGSDVIWWKCLSGSFFNLYFKSIGGQCIESYLIAHGINGAGGPVPVSNTPTASVTASSSAAASSTASASASSSAGGSSSVAASTTPVNGTASASASGSASTTVTVVSSSGATTVVGGHHTTMAPTTGGTHTQGGQQTTTTGGGGTASPAASSSSSVTPGGAAATLKVDMFGLAAGMLAMAVL